MSHAEPEIWKCCPGGAEVDFDRLRAKEGVVLCIRCGRLYLGPKTGEERRKRQDILALRPGDCVVPPRIDTAD